MIAKTSWLSKVCIFLETAPVLLTESPDNLKKNKSKPNQNSKQSSKQKHRNANKACKKRLKKYVCIVATHVSLFLPNAVIAMVSSYILMKLSPLEIIQSNINLCTIKISTLNGTKLNNPSFFEKSTESGKTSHSNSAQTQTFSTWVQQSCPQASNESISGSCFSEVSK